MNEEFIGLRASISQTLSGHELPNEMEQQSSAEKAGAPPKPGRNEEPTQA